MSARDVASPGNTKLHRTKHKPTKREIQDISGSLDLLVSVGSQVRKAHLCQERFQQDERVDETKNPPDQSGTQGCESTSFAEDVRLYGESASTTLVGYEKNPWPPCPHRLKNQSGSFKNIDEPWNTEHGDSVNPLEFSVFRLSSRAPSEEDYEKIERARRPVATSDVSATTEEIPRALLLRCWEQAVHAAATTLFSQPNNILPEVGTFGQINEDVVLRSRQSCIGSGHRSGTMSASQPTQKGVQQPGVNAKENSVDDTTQKSTTSLVLETPADEAASKTSSDGKSDATGRPPATPLRGPNARASIHVRPDLLPNNETQPISSLRAALDHTRKSRDRTIDKFKSLGIDLDRSKSSKLSCPNCKSEMPSTKALKDHFYGDKKSGNGKSSGCCWTQIISSQGSAVDQMLQSHINTQTDLLLDIIFEKAKDKLHRENEADTNPASKRRRLLGWRDIVHFAGDALDASRQSGRDGSPHPILETLQSKPKAAPLLFNGMLLETVKRRLIDRYAQDETTRPK